MEDRHASTIDDFRECAETMPRPSSRILDFFLAPLPKFRELGLSIP